MNYQAIGDFIVKIAPYLVALFIGIGSWIWGKSALKAKDDALGAKEETVRDLRVQLVTLKELAEAFRPARLSEDLKALHDYYGQMIDHIHKQAAERETALIQNNSPEQRALLELEIRELQGKLAEAEAGRAATEVLVHAPSAYRMSGVDLAWTRVVIPHDYSRPTWPPAGPKEPDPGMIPRPPI